MSNLLCSRRALVSVCAVVLLILFYAANSTARREVAAQAQRSGGAAWQQQPQSKQQDVPAELHAAIEETLYRLEPDATATGEAGYRAPNPAQGWRARFGAEGLSIETRAGEGRDATQRFAMRLAAYGYGERVVEVGRAEVSASKNRVEYRRGALVEWYLNERRGVEQGFTLLEPPATAEGARGGEPLSVRLAIEGSLRAEPGADGESVSFVDEAGAHTLIYDQLAAFDAGGRELPSRMRVEGREVRLEVDDAGAAYPLTIDPFIQQQRLQASDATAFHNFGLSIDISGDTAVVSAPSNNFVVGRDPGLAYIFTQSGGVWSQQQRLQASDAAGGDYFGTSVAIDGDTVIVGAPFDDNSAGSNAGSAYVFTRSGNVWSQQQRLQASNAIANGDFGRTVEISGDTAFVSASDDSSTSALAAGSVYVFNRSANVWSQQQQLRASDAADGDVFGNSIAVSGETLVVGARFDDNSGGLNAGSAYIFNRSAGVWSQQQRLQASDAASNDVFGISVAISGDTVVIGAYFDDNSGGNEAGSAYIFTRVAGVWSQQQRLQASDAATNDLFGISVAISGGKIAIGSINDDNSGGADAGSAYVFTRSAGVWSQQQRLQASDAAAGDNFGVSVALGGNNTIMVGAFNDDNSGGVDAGSVYVFFDNTLPGLIINEFRLSGPGLSPSGSTQQQTDEFIEIFNNTNTDVTVQTVDNSAGYALVASDGNLRFIIPNGTLIPARGHYLGINSTGFSYLGYPAASDTTATGDATYTADIPLNAGIALFNTANPSNFTFDNRLDAVGSAGEANTLYKEGTGYPNLNNSPVSYSLYRDLRSGTPKDSSNNEKDFFIVSNDPSVSLCTSTANFQCQRLGAPGPENLSSPVQRNATIKASLIDPGCAGMSIGEASNNTCARHRNGTPPPMSSATFGTLSIRRRFTNMTGAPVTRLRFRIVDITTFPEAINNNGIASLQAISSSDYTATCVGTGGDCTPGATVTVHGTTLEESTNVLNRQPNGGGFNSSLSAGTVTLDNQLNDRESINLQFLLQVSQNGFFRFFVNVEALPVTPSPPASGVQSNLKTGTRGKAAKSKAARATP
ncbi:MAG TPA: hypothetical protein VJ842_06185 [Pyrinomonadaceae bacterium]|nr:hypothetical protein [Pyrinomonadaceae bacterium]